MGSDLFFLKISIIIRDKMFNRISIEISAITVQLHGLAGAKFLNAFKY